MSEQKLTGMEMMVQSLLRAAGFNPAEIQQGMVTVIKQITTALDAAAISMRNMEIEQTRQRQLLEKLNHDMETLKAVAGVKDYDIPQIAEDRDREN